MRDEGGEIRCAGEGAGLGLRSLNFGENRSFFAKKVSKCAFCSKSEQFAHLLVFGE